MITRSKLKTAQRLLESGIAPKDKDIALDLGILLSTFNRWIPAVGQEVFSSGYFIWAAAHRGSPKYQRPLAGADQSSRYYASFWPKS